MAANQIGFRSNLIATIIIFHRLFFLFSFCGEFAECGENCDESGAKHYLNTYCVNMMQK